jgi:succinoglycan biosynthesis protein ExoL
MTGIAYFAHDLADPAVHRRVRFLQMGGATEIAVLGFRRGDRAVADVAGLTPVELARTHDRRLLHRVLATARALVDGGRWRAQLEGAEVVLARNLEMLLIAAVARRRFAPRASLVYECLDIHRLMLARGPAGALLRRLERTLLAECGLLVVSAPDFAWRYFRPVHGDRTPPICLLENKVLAVELPDLPAQRRPALPAGPPPGPPWRIGWFGNLHCRRSLHLLAGLAARSGGAVQVVLRGRPQRGAIPDFDAVVAATPGMTFHGPYERPADLAAIYGDVHLVWAIDLYDAGGNSDWLLMNRLYEGGLYGAVPIALASVATGRWLRRRGIGLLLEADQPIETALDATMARLDAASYLAARAAVDARPVSDFVHGPEDSAAVIAALHGRIASRPPSLRLPEGERATMREMAS